MVSERMAPSSHINWTRRRGEDNVPGLDVKVMGESHARGVEVTGQEADIYRGGRCQPQTDRGRKE